MDSQPSHDTRGAERRQADQPSTLRGSGSGPHDSWVHDVSSTGMRIECRADLAVGEEVSVGLAGAGATLARIVWRRGCEYGCAFDQPLGPEAAASAFQGSPIVRLHPSGKPAPAPPPDLESELLRMIEGRPERGRLWMTGLFAGLVAVAAPASLILARLTG